MVAAHTAAFRAAALGAEMRLAAGTPRLSGVEATAPPGERVFRERGQRRLAALTQRGQDLQYGDLADTRNLAASMQQRG